MLRLCKKFNDVDIYRFVSLHFLFITNCSSRNGFWPSKFSTKFLVELNMHWSELEKAVGRDSARRMAWFYGMDRPSTTYRLILNWIICIYFVLCTALPSC